jgi:hypothetical protein
MTKIRQFDATTWDAEFTEDLKVQALAGIEEGQVLFFPRLAFPLTDAERRFLSPATVGKSKNVSFDPLSGALKGFNEQLSDREALGNMMARFASSSQAMVTNLLPRYRTALLSGRTSFRPVEAAGRASSWRKDDTRLHVDSFPSAPVQDRRILRVFSNVNPDGKPRTWRLGGPFEDVAARFLPSLSAPLRGSAPVLEWLGITKSRRSCYDHFMLQLHDRMKADWDYQSGTDQVTHEFPPGSTWIVFTDQVSHAVMAGQYLLEQTFYLPVEAMQDPSKSPLRILERMMGRKLL